MVREIKIGQIVPGNRETPRRIGLGCVFYEDHTVFIDNVTQFRFGDADAAPILDEPYKGGTVVEFKLFDHSDADPSADFFMMRVAQREEFLKGSAFCTFSAEIGPNSRTLRYRHDKACLDSAAQVASQKRKGRVPAPPNHKGTRESLAARGAVRFCASSLEAGA